MQAVVQGLIYTPRGMLITCQHDAMRVQVQTSLKYSTACRTDSTVHDHNISTQLLIKEQYTCQATNQLLHGDCRTQTHTSLLTLLPLPSQGAKLSCTSHTSFCELPVYQRRNGKNPSGGDGLLSLWLLGAESSAAAACCGGCLSESASLVLLLLPPVALLSTYAGTAV
jgi:hypothetical protein